MINAVPVAAAAEPPACRGWERRWGAVECCTQGSLHQDVRLPCVS